ncbi:MAG: hypothetical protein ACRC1D_04100 [Culicoidibacterales bacterium]
MITTKTRLTGSWYASVQSCFFIVKMTESYQEIHESCEKKGKRLTVENNKQYNRNNIPEKVTIKGGNENG